MTRVEFITATARLDPIQKTHFYLSLARNITIAGRIVWSDEDISHEEQVHRLKWINEAMHRIINRISDLYHEQNMWTDDDIWEMLHHIARECPGINGDLGSAVRASLDHIQE
jgi:hypothetical protein